MCISGQPRFLSLGHKYMYHNFLRLNDCDVFVHSWFDQSELVGEGYGGEFFLDPDSQQKILDLYAPKGCIVEPQLEVGPGYGGSKQEMMIFVQYSMLYSALQSNLLRKEYERQNGFQYDVVVRTRFDTALLKPVIIEDLDERTFVGIDAIDSREKLCDWFYYSDGYAMDFAFNSYHDLDMYKDNLTTFCGEDILLDRIKKMNYEKQKLYPGLEGENLVLIRQTDMHPKAWVCYKDLPIIEG